MLVCQCSYWTVCTLQSVLNAVARLLTQYHLRQHTQHGLILPTDVNAASKKKRCL